MIIDSHCHLDYEPMFSSLKEVIERAKKTGVKYMLTISVTDKKYNIILDSRGTTTEGGTTRKKCVRRALPNDLHEHIPERFVLHAHVPSLSICPAKHVIQTD